MEIKGKKLDFFQELLEKSKRNRDESFKDLVKHRLQYEGSPQLDGKGAADASMVRNITYELIESQISTELPAARVDPMIWTERHDRNAKSVERLCATLRNLLPFERLNDMDERNTYIYGGSVWFVEWDNSIRTHSTVGGVRVTVISPEDFFPQPGVFEVEDMEWVILRFQTTREEIMDKYGISLAKASEAEQDPEAGGNPDDDEIVTIYMCLYKGDEGRISQYIWSGNTELSDTKDYYCRKRYVCKKCGKRRELCESEDKCDCGGKFIVENEEFEELTHDVLLSDGFKIPAVSPAYGKNGQVLMESVTQIVQDESGMPVTHVVDGVEVPITQEMQQTKMEATKIPWFLPTHLPVVVRKNISRERSVLGQSDCVPIRMHQQEINKVESRIHEKIMSAGSYPYKPQGVDFEYDDTLGERVLNIPPENSASQFGVLDLSRPLNWEQAQSDRLYDQAKRILGINDSYQGNADTTAKSGVAKQTQIAQAAGRLQSKRVMKNAAYADIDRVIFELYLAFADEPRPVTFIDEFGRVQGGAFNRYDFVEYDDSTHEWYYNDQYLFSADPSGEVEQQRELLWQSQISDLQAGVYGNPADPNTLLRFWQMRERAHYPNARENVEYFSAILKQQAMMAQQQPIEEV